VSTLFFLYRPRTDDDIVLVGDFNLPSMNWANFEAPYDDIHDVFLDFCDQRGLHKMVKNAFVIIICVSILF